MNFREIPNPNGQHYSFSEKVSLLDGSLWGQDLKWKEVEYLAKYFEVYIIGPNITILHEGDKSAPYIGLIMKGKVNVLKEDINGNSKILSHIGKGRTFGEMSVIDELPGSASIVTDGDVLLLVLEKKNFHRMMVDRPGLANKFLLKLLRLMSARLREVSGKLIDL